MEEITLQALLEAGCHFGHKAERWHPKAASFIYTKKDGIHIIDLAKTKTGLEKAASYVQDAVKEGKEILFVGTKRQARGIVKQEAENCGAPYFSVRWIGGFLTNWDQVRKNIEKINRMTEEQAAGVWKKFPKHEQVKMARYLERIKVYYGGVLTLSEVPAALFIIDVRKEIAAVREAIRSGISIIGLVDTNSDPTNIDYVIPANDDAVGSITFIVQEIAKAYKHGKDLRAKREKSDISQAEGSEKVQKKEKETKIKTEEPQKPAEVKQEPPKKRGRPKKI